MPVTARTTFVALYVPEPFSVIAAVGTPSSQSPPDVVKEAKTAPTAPPALWSPGSSPQPVPLYKRPSFWLFTGGSLLLGIGIGGLAFRKSGCRV